MIKDPTTWSEAKWPLPRPSVIRKNSDFKDRLGQSFMKVGNEDAAYLRLRKSLNWWWVATNVSKNNKQFNLQDKIRSPLRQYTIVAIGRMIDPKRCVGIVALK